MSALVVIKVCGVTNLEDAMAATEGGATAIGFNFYPRSKRYIAPELAARIAAALPPQVTKVGVFVNEPAAQTQKIAAEAGLDVAQLHGDESPGDTPAGLRVWKAFRVEEGFDPRRMDLFAVEACLLDGPAGGEFGGAGVPFTWRLAAGIGKRIIIAGGLDASNVREAIREARPWGVDACSRIESEPGRKDRRKMMEFLKAARMAEES